MSQTLPRSTRSRAVAVVAAAAPAPAPAPERLVSVRWVMALTDLVALVVAFAAAHVVRFPDGSLVRAPVGVDWLAGLATIVFWAVLLVTMRTRDPRVVGVGGDEYRRLLFASLTAGGTLAVTAFLLDLQISRGYVAVAFLLASLLLAVSRKAWRTALVRRRAEGRHLVDVLLVGDLGDVEYVGDRIESTPAAGYRVRGVLADGCPGGRLALNGTNRVPVLGGVDDVLDVARRSGVGAVVFAGAVAGGHERLRRLGWELERDGVEPRRVLAARRRRGRAGAPPSRRRSPADARRDAGLHTTPEQTGLRRRRRAVRAGAADAGGGRRGGRDPSGRRRAGVLPPAARRARWLGVLHPQVPDHVRRRRGPEGAAARGQRGRRAALQAAGRSPGDARGVVPPSDVARRASRSSGTS